MDVNFINAYTEVLTENFDSVIKQNFLLQTKLKLSEKDSKEKQELLQTVEELKKEKKELLEQNDLLNATVVRTEGIRNRAEELDLTLSEKKRIQSALNDSMRQVNSLSKKVEELTSYVEKLENIVPVTKLKKIKNDTEKAPVETDIHKVEVQSGGTF
jgi:predicted nuclease with TOPRIM domain